MKKLIALLLAALMVLSLAACASNAPASTDKPADTTTSVPSDTSEPADEPVEAPADEPADAPADVPAEAPAVEVYDGSLPIAEELTTFSIWESYEPGETGVESPGDAPGWQYVAELTNVQIEWDIVSGAAATEQFNLMFVSEDYSDGILSTTTSYKGGLSSYIEDEIIYDLRPIMETNAPNYTAIRNSDEGVYRDTMLDDGSIAGFMRVLATAQPTWVGMIVRADLLDQLGLADPVTVDDYTTVLNAFKEAGVESPLGTWNLGLDPVWLAMYGLVGAEIQGLTWIHKGDEAAYPMVQPEFKDYLTQMNAWYEARLLDQEFFAADGTMSFSMDYIAAGNTGMYSGLAPTMSVPHFMSQIEGFALKALPNPVLNEGDVRTVTQCAGVATRVEDSIMTVATVCEDVETFVRFLDFFYGETGSTIANWGMEGETYTLDENGEPAFMDIIKANPDGLGQADAQKKYFMYNNVTFLYNWKNQLAGMLPCAMAVYDQGIWQNNWVDERTMPTLALTVEESEAVGAVMGDIATYVGEMTVKFIIGQESLDDFDAYVEHIYEMGLQEAVDAYTAAYSRYTHRQ